MRKSGFVGQVFGYFGATALGAVFSIALLPLATSVLGPAEFGVYSYAMAVTALAAVLSDFGAGIVLPEHYHDLDKEERRRLLTTLLTASFTVACLLALLVFFAW